MLSRTRTPAVTEHPRPGLLAVVREWGRIGCIGFGGPPTHIALLRELCVERKRWLQAQEFEDAVAACNLLPGPASTQLALFCAWRVAGPAGALGGVAFIVPGLALILALAVLFLAASAPGWVRGAGAGAAVAAVAVQAGISLVPASWQRSPARARWIAYALLGGGRRPASAPGSSSSCSAAASSSSPGNGPVRAAGTGSRFTFWPLAATGAAATGSLLALAWVAFKVGALSYGGGFVIIPLMQADAVDHYHWMTEGEFLNAVALGQITPGPVVQTVAVVGYAAAGVGGGLLAALVAFAPSFAFVLLGANRFDRLRGDRRARAFLDGAGPAAIGAIIGVAVPLTLALTERWQLAVLAGAALLLPRAAPRDRAHAAPGGSGRCRDRPRRRAAPSLTHVPPRPPSVSALVSAAYSLANAWKMGGNVNSRPSATRTPATRRIVLSGKLRFLHQRPRIRNEAK